ncbi:MAG TPA: hypothetical protein PKC18_06685 [Lacipirellulaceae bacterium]|nr:hypothetical protein [Lacipirellulaceae bacterium]
MPDLVFATRGQAEALAAQESLRKAALDLKAEFESGAKATAAWDASLAKLKSAGEGALRSIQTEQEKIVDKIAKIEQAQKKGLIPPEEAEQGIKRLRQQWVEADEATIKHRENLAAIAAENDKIKTAAEGALRSVQTEQEKLLVQIDKIGQAQKRGLVPPAEAQEAIRRLRQQWVEVDEATVKQREAVKAAAAEHSQLKSAAESALRSIQSEQDKILERIAKIEEAQAKGLIPPEEAEQAIARLREKWTEVDEATLRQKEAVKAVAAEHTRLRSTAESAIRSIWTEEERLLEKIKEIEAALEQGLVPPEEAEQAIARYREKIAEAGEEIEETTQSAGRLQGVLTKAFDPLTVAKWAASFVGVKAALRQIGKEFSDIQDGIDRRAAVLLGPENERETLEQAAQRARDERDKARQQSREAQQKFQTSFSEGGEWGPSNPAWIAAQDAQAEAEEANRRAAAAERALAEFAKSDRARKSARLRDVTQELDAAFESAALASDDRLLTTEQRQKLDNLLREAGQGYTRRTMESLLSRLWGLDNAISTDEAASMLRVARNEMTAWSPFIPGAQQLALGPKELSPREQRIVDALDRVATAFERSEFGLLGTGE